MLTLDCNFSPSFLYFLKSVVVTEKILSDRWPEKLSVLKFHLGLGPCSAELHYGTLSQFCPTCICNLVIATVGNSRDSDPKQSHSAMRQNTDPVSRGSWPVHLYRRPTGPRMKRSHGTKTTVLAGKQRSVTLKRKVT